jgi:hypothetical protein
VLKKGPHDHSPDDREIIRLVLTLTHIQIATIKTT